MAKSKIPEDRKEETEYIELPEDRTPSEIEHDRQLEALDTFFAGIQPGTTLLIERLQPSWCSGLLEEVTVTEDSVNLDYFIETWGGRLLSAKVRGKGGTLRGSYKIPLHSYPPLLDGEILERPSKYDRFKMGDDTTPQNPVVSLPPVSQAKDILATLVSLAPIALKMWEGQKVQRQQDMQLMLQMAQRQNSGGLSGIGDIAKLGSVMGQLREVFKESAGEGGGGDLDFMGQAMDVIKLAFGNAHKEEPKARLTAPSKKVNSPPPAKVTPLRSVDIPATLATMDPNDSAGLIMEALGKMSPDKRQAAVAIFAQDYNATMQRDPKEPLDEEFDEEKDDRIRGT